MLLVLSWLISCGPPSGEGFEEICEHAFYVDADGDGHGDPTKWAVACDTPSGYVATADDCDDASAFVHPGAGEICDEIDDDCDGSIDGDAIDARTWFVDRDADGFGDDASEVDACVAPAMHVDVGGDCDDSSDAIHPGAAETCDDLDDDCDGLVDADDPTLADGGIWYPDTDGDQYGDPSSPIVDCQHPEGTVSDSGDCDDTRAEIRPDSSELCDGIDNDCDGLVDDDDPGPLAGTTTYYADTDADGLGDPRSTHVSCAMPKGFVDNDGDCDDGDAATGGPTAWYLDWDHDGYGEGASSTFCNTGSTTWAPLDGDCDNDDASISPVATEVCNEVDDNCDGLVDDDDPLLEADTWYADDDGDGYGDPATTVSSCDSVSGFIRRADDCDPTNAEVHPEAPEQCDTLDNDCDGSVDESVVYSDWYRDDDGDGYGTPLDAVNDCVRPSGYVALAGDCDDLVATTGPDAEEICANDNDDDCDGAADNCTIGLDDASAGIEGGPSRSWSDYIGQAVAVADLDGDGAADLLVGDEASAIVSLVYGPLSSTVALEDTEAITTTVSGRFGSEVETGDVNGDGATDAIVGDFEYSTVYAFLGPITGSTETADADAVYVGATFGLDDAAVLGDVDGDGVPDLAIGSPWTECTIAGVSTLYCGAVFVSSGASTGTVDLPADATYAFLATEKDELGIATVSIGDATGDGIADLALAAGTAGSSLEGAVYLVAGGADAGSYDPDVFAFGQITSELAERRELSAILTSADYDDDGRTDLFVGAPDAGADNAGAVYLFYGPLSGDTSTTDASIRWESTETSTALGSSVSVGDVDADGERDVLMAGVGLGSANGGAWLQLGKASGVIDTATLPSFRGSAGDAFGSWSALVPDWNGDLGDEIAVGAPSWEDASGQAVGKIWVFSSEAF